MKIRRCIPEFLFLAALLPLTAEAQTSSLFVRVIGPTGPIARAEVSVVFAGTAFLPVWTDYDGNAHLSPLPAGTYSVQVRAFALPASAEPFIRLSA